MVCYYQRRESLNKLTKKAAGAGQQVVITQNVLQGESIRNSAPTRVLNMKRRAPKHVGKDLIVPDFPVLNKDREVKESVVLNFEYHPKQQIASMAVEAGARVVFFLAGIRSGKCLEENQGVLLEDGTRKAAKDLTIGDRVLSYDPSTGVSASTPVTGISSSLKEVCEAVISDGSKILVTPDHRFPCYNIKRGRLETQTIEYIAKRWDNYMYLMGPKLVEFSGPRKPYPIKPYFLGLLLGDGSFTKDRVSITTADSEIVSYMQREMPENMRVAFRGAYEYSLARTINHPSCKNYFVKHLKELGLMGTGSYTKFIPHEYMTGSVEDRLDLIAGLIDTDGHIDRGGSVEYTTCSRDLAVGFQFILRSLGMRSKIKHRVTHDQNGTPCSSMRICFTPTMNIPLRIKRKSERLALKTGFDPSRCYVKSIRSIGERRVVDISVEHKDHLFLLDNFVATHNSVWMVREMAKQPYVYDATPNIAYLVSPTNGMMANVRSLFANAVEEAMIDQKVTSSSGPAHFILKPSNSIPDKYFIVEMHSGDNPNRMRGRTICAAGLDEVQEMKPEVFEVVKGRVMEVDGVILMCGTATFPGHWTKTEVIDRAYRCGQCHVCVYDHYDLAVGPDGKPERDRFGKETRRYVPKDHDPKDCYGDPRIAVIVCSSFDNTFLDAKHVEQLRQDYANKDPIIARRELFAEYLGFEGLCYSRFDKLRHQSPYNVYNVPADAYICAGLDFGANDPTAAAFLARVGDTWHVIGEYCDSDRGKAISDHVIGIKKAAGPIFSKIKKWWYDPSGRIVAMEMGRQGISGLIPARKRKSHGENWKKWRIGIINGLILSEDEKGRPHFLVNPSCKWAIENLENKKWKRYTAKGEDGRERVVDLKGKEVDRNASDDVAPGHDHCLTAGHLIDTSTGPVPIEMIPSDAVVLTRSGYRRVRWAKMTSPAEPTYRVRLSNGESLVATAGHPVYVDGFGWRPVIELSQGDRLVSESSASTVNVVSVEPTGLKEPVYNISVEGDAQEFFANGVLVHNCSDSIEYAITSEHVHGFFRMNRGKVKVSEGETERTVEVNHEIETRNASRAVASGIANVVNSMRKPGRMRTGW